jgi:hypothetical protein
MIKTIQDEQGMDMQWWGYSKEHGWVVLDRRVPTNVPTLKSDLLFLRCDDATTFYAKREKWNPPAYKFAPNHLRDLAPEALEEAAAEFEALKARWPEFEQEIQRVCREEDERVKAEQVKEEKARKDAVAEKKKQTAAAKV